jgi:hypothetical protein
MQIEPYEKHFGRGNRRPFQFSLRALMFVTAAVAVIAAVSSRWGLGGLYTLLIGVAAIQMVRGFATRRADRATVGGCALVVLLLVGLPLSGVAHWIGHKTISIQLVVVDAATDMPVIGAAARIRQVYLDPAPLAVPPGEPGVQGMTAADGRVVLSEEFTTGGRDGLLEHAAFVVVSDVFLVQVTAKGYSPFQARLATLVGRSPSLDDPFPSGIKIKLLGEPGTQ